MSKVLRFYAPRPATLKPNWWYRLRQALRGGNPEPREGRKCIRPGDDYGSWSNGFHDPVMPAKKPR